MSVPLTAVAHAHGGAGIDAWGLVEAAALTAVAAAAVLYGVALWTSRGRSPWPCCRRPYGTTQALPAMRRAARSRSACAVS